MKNDPQENASRPKMTRSLETQRLECIELQEKLIGLNHQMLVFASEEQSDAHASWFCWTREATRSLDSLLTTKNDLLLEERVKCAQMVLLQIYLLTAYMYKEMFNVSLSEAAPALYASVRTFLIPNTYGGE